MAKTQKIDPAAAKARKQKIMLGVVGAVLVVLAAIQVPKLMKQLPAAPPRRLQRRRPTRRQAPRLLRHATPPTGTATPTTPVLPGAAVDGSPCRRPDAGQADLVLALRDEGPVRASR